MQKGSGYNYKTTVKMFFVHRSKISDTDISKLLNHEGVSYGMRKINVYLDI